MFKFIVVGTIATFASANHHKTHPHPVNRDLIAEIKAKATTWKPLELEENPLKNYSAGEVMGLLGTKI